MIKDICELADEYVDEEFKDKDMSKSENIDERHETWEICNSFASWVSDKLSSDLKPKRIWIVNQEMYVIGGCLPDLPESSWTTEAEADRRVLECWFETYEKVRKENPTKTIICEISPGEASISFAHSDAFYFKVYNNGSVPLCDTCEEFNALPKPK